MHLIKDMGCVRKATLVVLSAACGTVAVGCAKVADRRSVLYRTPLACLHLQPSNVDRGCPDFFLRKKNKVNVNVKRSHFQSLLQAPPPSAISKHATQLFHKHQKRCQHMLNNSKSTGQHHHPSSGVPNMWKEKSQMETISRSRPATPEALRSFTKMTKMCVAVRVHDIHRRGTHNARLASSNMVSTRNKL